MANEFVQTMADARVDARSLSDFMLKPASLMIERRLAPPINTLNYFLEYLQGLEKVYSQTSGMVNVNGVQVKPVTVAINEAIGEAVGKLGIQIVDSFELGATLTARNQGLRYTTDGKTYRWDGVLPKTVPSGSTPTSSGGFGANAWIEVSDVAFRQDLANPTDKTKGAALVGFNGTNLFNHLESSIYWVSPAKFKQTGDVDDTASFSRMMQYINSKQGGHVYIPKRDTDYVIKWTESLYPKMTAISTFYDCDGLVIHSDGANIITANGSDSTATNAEVSGLGFIGCDNIKLTGTLMLDGNDSALGTVTSADNAAGLTFRGCSGGWIENWDAVNYVSDGIAFESDTTSVKRVSNKDFIIFKSDCLGNRRSGLRLRDIDGLQVFSSNFNLTKGGGLGGGGTFGGEGGAGVDILPYLNQGVYNVSFYNCNSLNNAGNGFVAIDALNNPLNVKKITWNGGRIEGNKRAVLDRIRTERTIFTNVDISGSFEDFFGIIRDSRITHSLGGTDTRDTIFYCNTSRTSDPLIDNCSIEAVGNVRVLDFGGTEVLGAPKRMQNCRIYLRDYTRTTDWGNVVGYGQVVDCSVSVLGADPVNSVYLSKGYEATIKDCTSTNPKAVFFANQGTGYINNIFTLPTRQATLTNPRVSVVSNTITANSSFMDLIGASPTDDLTTINGGVNGSILMLTSEITGRSLVVKHNIGNILLSGGLDMRLEGMPSLIALIHLSGKWIEVSRTTRAI